MDIAFWQQFHPDDQASDSDNFSDDEMIIELLCADLSSEEEEIGNQKRYRSANKDRRRFLYDHLLHEDYWGPNPVYNANDFKARFRLPIKLFDEIVEKLQDYDSYFVQKRDAFKKLGLSARQKISNVIRILASGVSAEQQGDKFRMGKTTTREAMIRFCAAIQAVYGEQALRKPTAEDLENLLVESYEQGWPGCIGSIDCMHWTWKSCPA